MTSTSTAASLAILKVNWERLGHDYIDNFAPFVISTIAEGADDAISLPDLQSHIKSAHGLLLPLHALKTLLNRAAKDGFVRVESHVFFRDPTKCSSAGFLDLRQQVEAGVTRLVSALRTAADELHNKKWSANEAEDALVAFVADEGLETLYASVEGRIIAPPLQSADSTYIVASFCSSVQQLRPDLFEDFLTLAKGTLLANALYLPELGKLTQRFVGTTVFLDTSLLVYACGFAGDDRQAPARELLLLLREYGASLGCFRETVEEVRGILDSCAALIRTKNLRYAYGPSIEHFVAAGTLSTDIDLLAARCESHIEKLGVHIEDRPAVTTAYQIDEVALQAALKREIGYKKERALIHDVDCLSAILRHRRGGESNSIENCRAVFVTTNAELARVGKRFFQPDVPPGTVAPCITANALANVLWLKSPTAAPSLPRSRVIADAFAAMQPDETLWKLYLTETARLERAGIISAEEYYLLRHAHSAKRALMDITRGVADAFTEGTVKEILDLARRQLRADLTEELVLARTAVSERDDRLARTSDADQRRAERVARLADTVARVVALGAFGVLMAVLAIATLYTFPWSLPSLQTAWWRYGLSSAQALLFLYSIANIGWGASIKGLINRQRDKLAAVFSAKARAYLELPLKEDDRGDERGGG